MLKVNVTPLLTRGLPQFMKPVKFKSVLVCDPPDKGWHYVPVEAKFAEKFEKKDGTRRVVCMLNGTENFQCALMPYNGTFYIMVNKVKRTKLGLAAGDEVTVELTQDESKYGMPMPEELQEVFRQDPEGDKLFHSLTAGKQRSLMWQVSKGKDLDQRIHRALIVMQHLKDNAGRVDGERLQKEFRQPLPEDFI